MELLESIWAKARNANKKIVLPETEDPRTLKAADLITKSRLADIILIGEHEKTVMLAAEHMADISRCTIIDPIKSPKLNRYIEIYMNRMKEHKKEILFNEAKSLLETDFPFFGAMMVEDGDADGMVSGASHATAHTIRATIYSVGLKPGISTLSSFFIMVLQNKQLVPGGVLFYADCAVVPSPDEKQLCDIALSTASSYRSLIGKEPKIAMLSFSTLGSGKSLSSIKVAQATKMIRDKSPELAIEGEIQFDAALVPAIGKAKAPESKVAGKATVLIFPNLDAGNISYKITERLAGAMALGPIFQGCAKPINDLSRGCSVDDIVNISAITAIQAS